MLNHSARRRGKKEIGGHGPESCWESRTEAQQMQKVVEYLVRKGWAASARAYDAPSATRLISPRPLWASSPVRDHLER